MINIIKKELERTIKEDLKVESNIKRAIKTCNILLN